MADIRQLIATNVRKFRNARGWSQEELSFEADIHRTYISQIECGARNPTATVIQRLADALGVEAAELLRKVQRSTR